jgi:hypothetical protein
MKQRYTMHAFSVIATFALATAAWAVDPVPGTYNSIDLGGPVLLGRGTQSWVAPLNAAHGVGDVLNSASWNGAALGTQWSFSCAVQAAAQTVTDHRIAGTGTVVFDNTFNGGTFFLSKTGPWSDGIHDLAGTLGATHVIATVQYVNNQPVGSRLNIDSAGLFDGSQCTLTFAIANGIGLGDTDSGALPANYPAFLAPDCSPTRVFGSWGDASQITFRVDCPVPVHSTTWGRVKAIYR